jgi:hypothetical protein
MTQLCQCGTELSVNRVANGEFTPEARGFMFGAAAAGESHSRIAKALGAKDTSTVSHTINRMHTRKTGVTGNHCRGKYKTTPKMNAISLFWPENIPKPRFGILFVGPASRSPQGFASFTTSIFENWRKTQRILLTE